MKRILPENPSFASPAQAAKALLDWADGKLSDPELATVLSKSQVAISRLPQLISNRKRRQQMPRFSLARRVVTRIRCTRTRARRSPASTRRATTDSGGDDGGDPEPPRSSLSCGGAL